MGMLLIISMTINIILFVLLKEIYYEAYYCVYKKHNDCPILKTSRRNYNRE